MLFANIELSFALKCFCLFSCFFSLEVLAVSLFQLLYKVKVEKYKFVV